MFRNSFFIAAVLLFTSVISASVARAQVHDGFCGGDEPCECGDRVIASRTLSPTKKSPDPVVKTVCEGHGLIIETAGVALNLNGGKLQGSGTDVDGNPTVGILITANNVTVERGAIFHFSVGIEGTTDESTVSRMSIKYSEGDGISLTGDDNTVTKSPSRHNGGNGTTVVGNGNELSESNNEYNGGSGFFVDGDDNQLIALKASENRRGGNGIVVIGDHNTIRQSGITKLNTRGIVVDGDFNELIENQVTKQKGDGITVDGNHNILTNNTATINHGVGIRVSGEGDGTASEGNRVSQNRSPQCQIYGITTPPTCIVGTAP